MFEMLIGCGMAVTLVSAGYFFGILFGAIRMPLRLRKALSAAGIDVSRMP